MDQSSAVSKALQALIRPDAMERLVSMLAQGFDANVLLTAACHAQLEAAVDLLLEQGADPNLGLLASADDQRHGILRKLLARGGDPNYGNLARMAVILAPAHVTYRRAVAELLTAGALANVVDVRRRAPLHLASAPLVEASPETIRLLVESGADIEMRDDAGSTPLHLAAECGSVALVETLLEQGAECNARDDMGRTPTERAKLRWQEWGADRPEAGPDPDWAGVIARLAKS